MATNNLTGYIASGNTIMGSMMAQKGAKGDKGDTGNNGYTPVKGVDYFTEQDIEDLNIPTKTSDLDNDSGFIGNTVDNLTNYYKTSETYNKTEIDGKISAVYKYKGTVSTYGDLPSTNLTVGDVYNIETADSTHSINAGDNVAWNGSSWDKLGGDIDLSGYQSKIDSSHKLSSDLVDDTNNTNKFVSAADKTNWNGKANASDVYDKTASDSRYLQNSKVVVLTQSEYDALQTIDSTVFYMIKEV